MRLINASTVIVLVAGSRYCEGKGDAGDGGTGGTARVAWRKTDSQTERYVKEEGNDS